MTQYLGAAAPEDLDLISDEVLKIQIETANYLTDPKQRFDEVQRLKNAKGNADPNRVGAHLKIDEIAGARLAMQVNQAQRANPGTAGA